MRAASAYRYDHNVMDVAYFFLIFDQCCGNLGRFGSDDLARLLSGKIYPSSVRTVGPAMLVGTGG